MKIISIVFIFAQCLLSIFCSLAASLFFVSGTLFWGDNSDPHFHYWMFLLWTLWPVVLQGISNYTSIYLYQKEKYLYSFLTSLVLLPPLYFLIIWSWRTGWPWWYAQSRVLSAGTASTLSVTKLLLASSSIKFRDPYPIPATSQRRLTCSCKLLYVKHPSRLLGDILRIVPSAGIGPTLIP